MRTLTSLALVSALSLVGCSSDETSPSEAGPKGIDLAPPPAGEGVQFKMVTTIEAGTETERCQLIRAPEEGMYVKREEVRFSPGSHHVLLYATPYKEFPTEDRNGNPIDAASVHDCTDGPTAVWEVTGVIGGSQTYDGDSLLGTLPDGVALKIEPGTVVLMNTHYVNASPEPLVADARINLYSTPEEEVEFEAGMLFYYNPYISVPANGASSARMRCAVHRDISVIRVQSHMHRRGVNFVANLTDAEGETLSELYTTTRWENVPAKTFDPVLHIEAGQQIDYRCDYENPEARHVVQGLTSRDEMCMLIGPYYPRDVTIENCLDEQGYFTPTWVGSGTSTCEETLNCITSARGEAEFFGCIVNSCPGASTELSAFMRCQETRGDGACDEACAPGGTDCERCMEEACAAAVDACKAATCD